MEINLDPKLMQDISPSMRHLKQGMELVSKSDGWTFIELKYKGTRSGDEARGFIAHQIGTNKQRFYTIDELISDWEPLQK